MTRCSGTWRVFYWEEPVFGAPAASLEIRDVSRKLKVAVPHLPSGLSAMEVSKIQKFLLNEMIRQHKVQDPVAWYYTPMARDFSKDIGACAIVYDCMDELSAFRGAPAGLTAAEAELFRCANLVFTGGKSLYESKRRQHAFVHCFPSSIDREFFASARRIRAEVKDQQDVPHPRIGFCGVIDERMDLDLLAAVADARPDWHLVLLGPVVKISESDLPRKANIHYLGQKDYGSLPAYFAGWNVGLLPFARNESTRYISPTKTPEYLAAGLPVVSTPITDVVDPYGVRGLAHIAESAPDFVRAIENALPLRNCSTRLAEVDRYLCHMSWDSTWKEMSHLICGVVDDMRAREGDGRSVLEDRAPDGGVECSIT
ncbi:MAG TPA: glycosyltransferase [Dongiaceae bacterium]|nr:glycosyltransferase [Dongiaceae bacterium]